MTIQSGIDEPDFATTAAYFQYGLAARILDVEQARAWALAIVEARDRPPPEIVEVLASRNFLDLLETLKAVPGLRDVQLAGRWLLHTLRRMLADNIDAARAVTRQSLQVAQATGLDEDIRFAFDGLDDLFGLAESETYGTVEDCRTELLAVLSRCEATPELQSC